MTEELKILVKAEVAQAVSNLKEASRAADNVKKSAGGITDGFKGLANFMMGPIAAIKGGIDVIGGLISAVDDLKKEYEEAEVSNLRFSASIETSEMLFAGAEDRLASYIGTLKEKTIADDDDLKAQAGLLAGYGRTEAQIKKILDVALDYSAATGKTLPESVQALNQSLNGNTRELGRNFKEIKDLSEEQLANGAALDVLGKKYDGFSEKLRKTSAGTRAALEREIEDIKEQLGEMAAAVTNPVIERELAKKAYVYSAEIAKKVVSGDTRGIGLADQVKYLSTYTEELGKTYTQFQEKFASATNKATQSIFKQKADAYKADYDGAKKVLDAKQAELAAQEKLAREQESAAKSAQAAADAESARKAEIDKNEAAAKAIRDAYNARIIAIGKESEIAKALGEEYNATENSLTAATSAIQDGINAGLQTTGFTLTYLTGEAKKFKDALPEETDLTIGGGATVEPNMMPDKVVENAAKYKQYLEDAQAAMDNLATTLGGSLQEFAKGLANEFLRSADSANALGQAFDSSSIEDYVVKAIDNLPMLLLTAGLQVVGYNPAVGIALIAASGLVALVDVFTTSEGERRAYGGSASTSAATASSTATASYSSRSASQSTGNVTVVQNIQGNVWTSRALEAMAQGA